jgi:hypothetical protein
MQFSSWLRWNWKAAGIKAVEELRMYKCSPGTTIKDGKTMYHEQMERVVISAGVSR